jgi:fatty-acyl-CoA synthase
MSLRRARGIARAAAVFAQREAFAGITVRRALAAVRVVVRGPRGPQLAVPLHAALHPRWLAVADGTRRLAWRALDREIVAVAAGLHGLGVRGGDRIAIVLHNSIEHVVVHHAAMRLGAIAVQVGSRLTAAEIAYILGDAAPAVVVCHARFAAQVRAARDRAGVPAADRIVIVGDAGGASYDELVRGANAAPRVDPGLGGLMTYTSGTTGEPKGARRAYRDGGYAPLIDFMRRVGMSPVDRHAVVCPLYHAGAFGFLSMMGALGAACHIAAEFDAEAFLALIERERITSAFLVPTMLERLLAVAREFDTSSLRWIASGAAPLATDTARRFQERFGPILWNFYGATETGAVTLAGPSDHATRPGTIGRPLRGNRIALLDGAGREVPLGMVGELYVHNALVIGGYHGNPDATSAAITGGMFSVGDLARRDADGYLYLEGRKSDMIITGGVNVYPREIEIRLMAHPEVADCAVLGMPDPEWGERVVAFVVPRRAVDPEALARYCRAELAGYKVPRRFELVAELPRNETGKVLKRVLRERVGRA